ncbi:unnamed protein product [Nesidiocoris tenuis]|uniref:Resistance to inhibitors of cholinesterase protein 3 N-terminal domain-containing protein n=1 Tax=Nesidiocoris tenuis TaxID=355587 RepID=A0A6H5HCH0_9HEMI|nr:unnamed protein product [Nesidiocoris tenuis]
MRPSIAWLMVLAFHSCLQTGLPTNVGNTRIRRPGRQVFRQFDNHRYHPTTYSLPDGDGYGDHYEHHHEADDGYHYSPIIHHPLPLPRPTQPPDKSKATISESDYAYYYIGRHLWYVPLYFSIYFIAYVGLLVLKSIARHKVLFPYKSEQTAQQNGRQSDAMYMLDSARRKYAM